MPALNSFFHRGPVCDPAYFFGRTNETRFIAQLLGAGQSVSLSGPRRFGKISLLFQLAHPQAATAYGLGPDSMRWVYIDGGMLDGLDVEWFYGAVDHAQIQTDLEQHLLYYWHNLDLETQYTLAALSLFPSDSLLPARERLQAAGLLDQDRYLGQVLETFIRRQPVEGLCQCGPSLLDARQSLVAVYGRPLHLIPTDPPFQRSALECISGRSASTALINIQCPAQSVFVDIPALEGGN